jgi:hypothetical protein
VAQREIIDLWTPVVKAKDLVKAAEKQASNTGADLDGSEIWTVYNLTSMKSTQVAGLVELAALALQLLLAGGALVSAVASGVYASSPNKALPEPPVVADNMPKSPQPGEGAPPPDLPDVPPPSSSTPEPTDLPPAPPDEGIDGPGADQPAPGPESEAETEADQLRRRVDELEEMVERMSRELEGRQPEAPPPIQMPEPAARRVTPPPEPAPPPIQMPEPAARRVTPPPEPAPTPDPREKGIRGAWRRLGRTLGLWGRN